MISPSGVAGDIPEEKAGDAIKAGFKPAQDMLSPKGKTGLIPLDNVHEAIKAGFQLKGAPIKMPQTMQPESVQPSNVGIALGEHAGIANPQQPAEQFALENPEQQGKLAGAAAIGAAGSVAPMAVKAGAAALLPAATKGVVAIGDWAEAHPIMARLVYEGIKGAAWYKLIKKAANIGSAGHED